MTTETLARYRSVPGHYDELTGPDGTTRPHWRPLLDVMERLGPIELEKRVEESHRILKDNGATYHIQRESGPQRVRPWPLDLVPVVLDGAEWDRLAQGVAQRATLLNTILADLYGPRNLIRDRKLPADLLYIHPGFLRPVSGIEPVDGNWLMVYGVDLARSEDGGWWVIGDRTDAPAGMGFALENRLVSSRTLPEAFHAGVRRLSGFFRTQKDTFTRLARHHRDNPRVVLLSGGPDTATHFEHAFMARYLGCTLVEGADLAVKDRRVFLKTLGGALPVDVVWRCLDSESCDPLELGSDSLDGAPGLLDSMRAGNVVIANAPGAGFAESPALMAFLPNLARHCLGEDLGIPSVATWWCGQPQALSEASERLSSLVVKPAFPGAGREPAFGSALAEAERAALRDRMFADPRAFVAQEQVSLSTVPVREDGDLAPRYLVIRALAVFDGQGYTVMPGGLARVSPDATSLDVSVAAGGSSKDLWVMGESDDPPGTLLPAVQKPITVSRATFDLSSRVAGNLYWLGRYTERLDAAARLIRAALPLLSRESSTTDAALAGALGFVRALGYARTGAGADPGADLRRTLADEVRFAVSDADRRGGLGWQIRQIHRMAWLLRDRLSADAWMIVSELLADYEDPAAGPRERNLGAVLDRIVIDLTSFGGAVSDTMTRGHGWRILEIGRRLERGLQLGELLRHGLVRVTDDERARIELLLVAADSGMTYRSRYLTSLQADLVIDLLLFDDANPRAVVFQLERLRDHVQSLPAASPAERRSPEARRLTDALAAVELADLDALSAAADGVRTGLERLLDRLNANLTGLSEDLTRDYLAHAALSKQ